MNEHRTVQCRVLPPSIIMEGASGTTFWATPTRAKRLAECGAVEIIGGHTEQHAGPTETKPAGATETKSVIPIEEPIAVPNESSAAASDGPSTDSAQLSGAASAELSSASEAVPVSPPSSAERSRRGGRASRAPRGAASEK